MKNAIVIAKLPKAGLANKLFVWAKAKVFSKQHNINQVTIGWFDLKIGPWLRREKTKRIYLNYFKDGGISDYLKYFYFILNRRVIYNPDTLVSQNCVYLFDKIPHWKYYFDDIKKYRAFIKGELYKNLSTKTLKNLASLNSPQVGMHIRLGDFRTLNDDKEFKSVGSVRTPLPYFNNIIKTLNEIANYDIEITIFTDGHESEIESIVKLPNVKLANKNSDIVDLLLLSKSKLIIMSAGSTFSYWAAFLSKADVIYHENFPINFWDNGDRFIGTIDEYKLFTKKLILQNN